MGVKQKKYKNGEEYNGDWSNNKRHGLGIHSWPDNRVYEGQFKEDSMHGHGKYQWPDNRLYEGSFVQDHMTGRGHYFQDKRDPLLEEISGEFLNGVLHGRGTCFKKILSPQNVTTGLVITVGYCWNRGTLHHGFEIIVDSNNNVQSIKQFKSNFKYSFDPHAGDILFENDNDVPVSVSSNTNGNLATTPTGGKVPLLSLSSISNASSGSLDAISPRLNNSQLTPNSSRSPRTPRNHLIKPVGINEAKIEQIEFIEAGELNRVKTDLVEKQSGLLHAWKEKLSTVQEKIKNLTKQKANLESQLAEATEELTYFRNKDTETEQRLEQYISQHKELFEEYEIVTNNKIKTLENTIHEINQVKEMEIAKKNSEMEELRQSLHNKIENLDREWSEKYTDLEKVKTTITVVDDSSSPTNVSISPDSNQSQVSAIPKRRPSIMRHRRSFSSMDTPQMQASSEGDDSTSIGSVSPASLTNSGTQVIGEDFDIESSPHATTTYKTLNSNTAINTTYETAQQRENKIIGRPRSNSQDNSSATSSIDIVRGTVNSAQLNIQEPQQPPTSSIDIATSSSSEKSTASIPNDPHSSENKTTSSNGNSSLTNSQESDLSLNIPTSFEQDNQHIENSATQSNQTIQIDISPRISVSETKHAVKSSSLENSPKSGQTSTWVSADILYQKIRENLKKTSSTSENSPRNNSSDSFDWRQVLKKSNNHK